MRYTFVKAPNLWDSWVARLMDIISSHPGDYATPRDAFGMIIGFMVISGEILLLPLLPYLPLPPCLLRAGSVGGSSSLEQPRCFYLP